MRISPGHSELRSSRPRSGSALIELLGGIALMGIVFGIFVSTLRHLQSIDGANLAANRATIILHNTLERIEVEGPVTSVRAEQILSEEFSLSELAAWGTFNPSVATSDEGVALRIQDDGGRVIASFGVKK